MIPLKGWFYNILCLCLVAVSSFLHIYFFFVSHTSKVLVFSIANNPISRFLLPRRAWRHSNCPAARCHVDKTPWKRRKRWKRRGGERTEIITQTEYFILQYHCARTLQKDTKRTSKCTQNAPVPRKEVGLPIVHVRDFWDAYSQTVGGVVNKYRKQRETTK